MLAHKGLQRDTAGRTKGRTRNALRREIAENLVRRPPVKTWRISVYRRIRRAFWPAIDRRSLIFLVVPPPLPTLPSSRSETEWKKTKISRKAIAKSLHEKPQEKIIWALYIWRTLFRRLEHKILIKETFVGLMNLRDKNGFFLVCRTRLQYPITLS